MKNIEVTKFYNRCLLKSMLIDFNTKELAEYFEKESDYDLFLKILVDLIYNEGVFLLLKDTFVFKIICVISEHSDVSEQSTNDLVDSLFEYFDRIMNIDSENKGNMLSNYKNSYEYAIGCTINDNDFLTCITNDYLLMKLLINDEIEGIDIDQSLLLSIDYLLYFCPDFFKEKGVYSNVMLLLDKYSEKRDMSSEILFNAKEIKSDIQKLLKRK